MMSDGIETRLEQAFDNYQRVLVDWNASLGGVHKARKRVDNNQNRILLSVAEAQLGNAYQAYKLGQRKLNEAVLKSWRQKPHWTNNMIKGTDN